MAVWIVKTLRLISAICCLIVLAAFAIFVVDESRSASQQQQEAVASSSNVHVKPAVAQKSGLHRTIDETAESLTSPFAGIVSSAQSEWGAEIVRTVLALLLYGVALGYVTRVISVRV